MKNEYDFLKGKVRKVSIADPKRNRRRSVSSKRKIKAVSIDLTVAEKLKDPEVAAAYVRNCLEEKGKHRGELLLQALMDVAKARGIGTLAKRSESKRRMIYKALSQKANPSLRTLESVLESLGLTLDVRPLRKVI